MKQFQRTEQAGTGSAETQPLARISGASLSKGGLTLQLSDVVISTMAFLVSAYLLIAGAWAPGAGGAGAVFALIGTAPLVLRWLAQTYPTRKVFDVAASFWLIPAAGLGHMYLDPLMDALNPRLMDPYLALADLHLFGLHPAVFLAEHAGPWVTEILMICYYSYFVLAAVLGVALFARGRRSAFEELVLALSLYYSINYALYLAVPAVGPRFFLAEEFSQPMTGLLLTPYLDALMRTMSFNRDCFPSGHTGATLIVLTYAFRHHRRVFWIILPIGTGLILATLVGRFHYGIDLLCALPLVPVIIALASAMAKARPHGVRIKRDAFAFQEPARI